MSDLMPLALAALLLVSGVQPAASQPDAPPPAAVLPQAEASTCELEKKEPACTRKGVDVRTLRAGTVIGDAIADGETHSYTVVLAQGQFLQALVEQQGVDLIAAVCAPDGTLAAEVDRQNGSWGPEAVSVSARMGGDYRLLVHSISSPGRYEVRVGQLRGADATDVIRLEAEQLVTEGGKYFNKGGPPCLRQSIKRFELALKLWELLDEPYEVAVTQYGLGWSFSDLGSHGMAKFPAPLHRIRWSYESRGDHLKALKYFEQAYIIMEGLGDRHGQAITLAGMAWPNLYLGRYEKALESFSQSRLHFRARNNRRGEAITTYGLGWVYALLNDNERALKNFLQALPLRWEVRDRKGEAITLLGIGRMYGRLGLHQEAFNYGRGALALFERQQDAHGKASALTIMGWASKGMGRPTDALNSFRAAYEAQPGDRTGMATALYGTAHVQSEQGDLAGALSTMEEVLSLIEPLRERGIDSELRTYYFANVQEYYEFYIQSLMRRHHADPAAGHADAAFRANERARARELLALLVEVDDFRHRQYDSELTQPLNVEGVKALLDDETLLIEYFLGAETSYVWLISARGVQSYELPKREEVEAAALEFYRSVSGGGGGRLNPDDARARRQTAEADERTRLLGARLGEILLGPVAAQLGSKRLVFVPQGVLQLIPFGALSLPPNRAYRPLIVDHEIVSLPSASILKVLRRNAGTSPRVSKTIAVIADPVFTSTDARVGRPSPSAAGGAQAGDGRGPGPRTEEAEADGEPPGGKFRRLFGTRWEAKQITSLVPQAEQFLALDFAASRETVLSGELSRYRIIHFATHAVAYDSNPARSKIVLTQIDEQGRPRDGDLTLTDVYKLNLQAELVVLNSCRTGLGPDVRGEGMVGLTGGFMRAGAPRVLVSLWSVSDRAAAELMVRVYRKMLGERRLSPAAALREAQIEAWRNPRWGSPYYWAPFTLQGEWRWGRRPAPFE